MLEGLVLAVVHYLPWLILAVVAGFLLMKRKGDKGLMLQAGGALLTFLLGMGKWLFVIVLIHAMLPSLETAGTIIFEFLIFVSLLIFVAGYCLERFSRNRAAVVSASPT